MLLPKIYEIEEILRKKNKSIDKLSCCILRNISVENIELYLKYYLSLDNKNLAVDFGNYDNIYQDSLKNSLIHKKNYDFIIVFLWLPNFSDILSNKVKSSNLKIINKEIKRLNEYCMQTIKNIRQYSKAPILWSTYDNLDNYNSSSIHTHNLQTTENIIDKLNSNLKKIISKSQEVFLLDLNKSKSKSNKYLFYDKRYWYSFRSPFGTEGLKYLSYEISNFIRAVFLPKYKCLVLDCDNVLWGGILGETGYDKINLINDNGDSEFIDFQKEVLNLYNTGTILAINSKNNLEDVMEVFKKNKNMILKENHFASIKANWNDKASNLREIAKELNIGLNSLVFADDSDFEINLIKKEIPEVKTLHLPIEGSEYNKDKLIACGYFDKMKITKEDKQKGKMYVDEKKRKVLLEKITDIKTYLETLKMKMNIQICKDENLDRVEQMIQKTNQFNLTTKRIKRNEILKIIKDKKKYFTYILSLKDKFGDYGTCGLSIVSKKHKSVYFDIFLMSCRVIGRGVEKAFLIKIMNEINAKNNINTFYGKFIQTAKNSQVKDFYLNNGFDISRKDINSIVFSFSSKNIKSLKIPKYLK